MHRFFFVISLLSSLSFSYAQYKINIDEEKIDLSKKEFEIIEIQDWRKNRNYLGVIYKGITNRPKIANIDGNITEKLYKIISSNQNENKLIIGLTKLNVKEVLNATAELGFVEIEIHAVEHTQEGEIDLGIYSFTQKYEGLDVTRMHAKNISYAFECVLNQISLQMESEEVVSLIIIKDEIEETKWVNLPIIDFSKINNGFYENFSSVKNNKPDTVVDFQIRGDETPSFYLKNRKGRYNHLMEKVYYLVVSDKNVYIGYENSYFRTGVKNGKWIFIGPARINNDAMNNAALVGGLIGATVVGSITQHKFLYQINTLDGTVRAVRKLTN